MRKYPGFVLAVYVVFNMLALARADLIYDPVVYQAFQAQPVIVAGDPSGSPPDSPANRVDPNTVTSPFGGVGSVKVVSGGTFLGSGTAITPFHVLTAAHLFDLDNNGTIDVAPANVTFNLNFGGDLSHQIVASALHIHPQYTGFNNPVVNDDIAIITLSAPLPVGVPIYPLYLNPLAAGTTLTLVGYGRSGDGISGYTTGPSFTVKRKGENNADLFFVDDEGSGVKEVFIFDFDGPTGNGFLGGPTLGNDRETTLGPGDSGGPAFVLVGSTLFLAGVNTFTATFTGGPAAPLFGSGGGGMIVSAYFNFIAQVTGLPEPSSIFSFSALVGGWLALRRRRR